MKVCHKCKTEKPLTEFGCNKNNPDGLDHYCRDCRRAYRQEHREQINASKAKYREKHRKPRVKLTEEEKKQKQREYYEANNERIKANAKQRRETNREAALEYQKEYRVSHKEEIRETQRRWHEEHREEARARKRSWRREHPEQWKAQHKAAKQRRRARLKGQGGSYTPAQLRECLEFFDNCCAYSGEPLQPDYHVDHVVPISKGGHNDIKNIVPANPVPNIEKSDKDWFDWFFNSEYFTEERYKKIIEWIES